MLYFIDNNGVVYAVIIQGYGDYLKAVAQRIKRPH